MTEADPVAAAAEAFGGGGDDESGAEPGESDGPRPMAPDDDGAESGPSRPSLGGSLGGGSITDRLTSTRPRARPGDVGDVLDVEAGWLAHAEVFVLKAVGGDDDGEMPAWVHGVVALVLLARARAEAAETDESDDSDDESVAFAGDPSHE